MKHQNRSGRFLLFLPVIVVAIMFGSRTSTPGADEVSDTSSQTRTQVTVTANAPGTPAPPTAEAYADSYEHPGPPPPPDYGCETPPPSGYSPGTGSPRPVHRGDSKAQAIHAFGPPVMIRKFYGLSEVWFYDAKGVKNLTFTNNLLVSWHNLPVQP